MSLKSRWIVQTLILSAALNATLLSIFFYFLLKESSIQYDYRPHEKIYQESPPLNRAVLARLRTFQVEQLIEMLGDERKIEQGYRVRDFALGTLATVHDIDMERALSYRKLTKRKWVLEGEEWYVFPGLKEDDFEKICSFLLQERWPFTPKGLFKKIQEVGLEHAEPELLYIFCYTPPFVLLETLFARTQLPIRKKNILALAVESGWEQLESFYKKQQESSDFSAATRRKFLIDSITGGSKIAAYLLLITDAAFVLKELDDSQIERILDLLSVKSAEAVDFVKSVAQSARGDSVIQKAALRCKEFGENIPVEEIVGHFIPHTKNLRPFFREVPPASLTPGIHTIQEGESLWTIAHKYRVSLELLKKTNHLNTDVIQPGKTLIIPHP